MTSIARRTSRAIAVAAALIAGLSGCLNAVPNTPPPTPRPDSAFTVNAQGGIDIDPGDNYVTQAGDFPQGGGVAYATSDTKAFALLVIRHTVDGVPREDVYTASPYAFDVTATPQHPQQLAPGRVLVDAAPGTRVVLSPNEEPPSGAKGMLAVPYILPAYVGSWSGTATPTPQHQGDGVTSRSVSLTLSDVESGAVAGSGRFTNLDCDFVVTLEPPDGDPLHADRIMLGAELYRDPRQQCGDVRFWIQLQPGNSAGSVTYKTTSSPDDVSPDAITAQGTLTRL